MPTLKSGRLMLSRIQVAALECFKEMGYEGTTMVQISRRAGVSPAALYLHFPGKRELFESLNRPDLDFPPLRAAERRQEILGAALKIFAHKGYAGATMEDVAKAVGLSKAALYGYFSGKEQLFAAVIQNAPEFSFLDGLAAGEPPAGDPPAGHPPAGDPPAGDPRDKEPADPEAVLRKVALGYLAMFRDPDKLGLMRILLAEGGRESGLSAASLRSAVWRGSTLLGSYLSRLGFGPLDEMRKAAQAFIGMLFSWVVQNRVLIQPAPEEAVDDSETEMAERAVRLLLHGLKRSV